MPLFDYEFTIWPQDHEGERSVFEVFRHLTPRASLTMTEGEFSRFVGQLHESGLAALEATKEPHRNGTGASHRSRHVA